MVDTQRTQAELLALGTEGVAASWSFQDQRDLIWSMPLVIPQAVGNENFLGDVLLPASSFRFAVGPPYQYMFRMTAFLFNNSEPVTARIGCSLTAGIAGAVRCDSPSDNDLHLIDDSANFVSCPVTGGSDIYTHRVFTGTIDVIGAGEAVFMFSTDTAGKSVTLAQYSFLEVFKSED